MYILANCGGCVLLWTARSRPAVTLSHAGKAYFLRVAKLTTGIASINKTQLCALPVEIPPIERQTQYRNRVHQMTALIRALDGAAAKAEAMAAALSAGVFDMASDARQSRRDKDEMVAAD